jgi:hypothetical protein
LHDSGCEWQLSIPLSGGEQNGNDGMDGGDEFEISEDEKTSEKLSLSLLFVILLAWDAVSLLQLRIAASSGKTKLHDSGCEWQLRIPLSGGEQDVNDGMDGGDEFEISEDEKTSEKLSLSLLFAISWKL